MLDTLPDSTPRVLLADDERMIRDSLAELLTAFGFEVVGTACDGLEAVRLVADLFPDVVLMDLRMPNMDGLAATAAIKRDHPWVQVLILSAYEDQELQRGGIDAGAYCYLVKGGPVTMIRDMIERAAAFGESRP